MSDVKQVGSQKNEAQYFALLTGYYHFRFRACGLHKVFGTRVFLYLVISMLVFPVFFSRIGVFF